MSNKQNWKGLAGGIAGGLAVGVLSTYLILGGSGSSPTPGKDSEIVATVGADQVTKDELYEALVIPYGTQVLNTLISDIIIEKEAKVQEIEVEEKLIDDEVNRTRNQYGGDEGLNFALEQGNMTMEDLRANITKYFQMKALVEPRISISDEEVEDFFNNNKADFDQPETVKASHILVTDKDLANEIYQKIQAGEDFAELAKEYSIDDANKDDGGDLGYFDFNTMVEPFSEVAFSMEVGEISEPVETMYGHHIIKLEDKQAEKEATLEEVKDDIKEMLTEQSLDSEYSIWIEEMKHKYKVENSLEDTEN